MAGPAGSVALGAATDGIQAGSLKGRTVGTNYYLHLGKVSSQGKDRPRLFLEATDVAALDQGAGDLGWVQDEYGQDISWSEFLELWQACQYETHHGENFS